MTDVIIRRGLSEAFPLSGDSGIRVSKSARSITSGLHGREADGAVASRGRGRFPVFERFHKGLHEGEQVVLNPILSEVEQHTSEESPLASEPTLAAADLAAVAAAEPVRDIAATR